MATHSTEIISECNADEIVVIDKSRPRAKRLRSSVELGPLFIDLGSLANPVLTQLAKTRRVLFVEGGDFKLLAKFAQKCGLKRVAIRSDFAVVPVDGFNPDRVRSLKAGMEHPLGRQVLSGVILDRDYRSTAECGYISDQLATVCDLAVIHRCKEIENFVLVPQAIDRLVAGRVRERRKRDSRVAEYENECLEILLKFADQKKIYLMSQFTERHKQFQKGIGSKTMNESLFEEALKEFEERWVDIAERLAMIPGKEALTYLNGEIQRKYKVSVTPVAIIEAMRREEVPQEMVDLLTMVERFAVRGPPP